ncbi:hypothetical protein [Falsibacillus albus]|uniref:Uncharacterized protein n=1 Tax=Falsibacillus albus TaxID=2478915 RepID=A0A3L7JYH5_9BACI|nr:hypothetical protein [Falsibacillus albus]RLQ95857.1 hypothetical protein D9X91_09575 [Falsibacillus albus]
MDIENIWNKFIQIMNEEDTITRAVWKKIAGIPFIYIQSPENPHHVEHVVKKASAQAMKGKQLKCETIFVRKEESLHVYRHRFYVPQEKMFCCGNMCNDCVRLKPNLFWH